MTLDDLHKIIHTTRLEIYIITIPLIFIHGKMFFKSCPLINIFFVKLIQFLCLSLPFSAGAGRTGVIIAIHAMMELAEEKAQVDIYNFVFSMRNSRPNIVQTAVSIIFCAVTAHILADLI